MKKPTYNKDFFPHWMSMQVRFRDLDPLNHVNNAIFCTYYEDARIAFIQNEPAFEKNMRQNFSFVLANVHINYIKPVEYPSVLLVGSGIKKLGNTSITSFQAIYRKESKKLVSTAESTGVWLDLKSQKPAEIPEVSNIDELIVQL